MDKELLINELIKRLAESNQEIVETDKQYSYLKTEQQNEKLDKLLNSAMLADICEVLFGGHANGSPDILGYVHSGWACGPLSKPEGTLYIEWVYKQQKIEMSNTITENIKKWKEFISTIKSNFDQNGKGNIAQ